MLADDRRLLTTDQIADYLIYPQLPAPAVFFDSRHNYYGEKMGAAYLSVINGGHQWRSVMDEFHFNVVLVSPPMHRSRRCYGTCAWTGEMIQGERQLYPVRAGEKKG